MDIKQALHEAGHVLLARDEGYSVQGVFLSGDDATTVWNDDGDDDPRKRIRISLGGVVAGLLAEDPSFKRWNTLATRIVEAREWGDAKVIREALFALGYAPTQRREAIALVAQTAAEVADTLARRGREWCDLAERIEAGDLTPKRRGGHRSGRDGRPVYFAAYDAPMPTAPEYDVETFTEPPTPKRRNPLNIFRRGDKYVIEGGDDADQD